MISQRRTPSREGVTAVHQWWCVIVSSAVIYAILSMFIIYAILSMFIIYARGAQTFCQEGHMR